MLVFIGPFMEFGSGLSIKVADSSFTKLSGV